MGVITVGIGEWGVSKNAEDTIKTYALGSCVAVIIYDVKVKVGGLIHVALPESAVDPARAAIQPGYFADSGLPRMIEELKLLGATRAGVWVKLAGGASVMDAAGYFDIGKRNVLAIKKILWKSSLGPVAEDTGGNNSRTVAFSIADGSVVLSSGPKTWNL